jgi:dTDP-4-dehydrorhamnose 3,5-epimerase
MRLEPLALDGAWLITPEPAADERGFFARIICVTEFASHNLNGAFVQSSISYNRKRGTFRGMHFQWPPSREAKLVRCVRGSICDILLDLRPGSPTFRRQAQVTLDDVSRNAVYIPWGFAHGFQTLADHTEVQYHMTDEFRPDLADGLRWDDPAFDIVLPEPVRVIAPRDSTYPLFDLAVYEARFRSGVAQPVTP